MHHKSEQKMLIDRHGVSQNKETQAKKLRKRIA